MRRKGRTYRFLAAKFRVDRVTVKLIFQGKIWRHVTAGLLDGLPFRAGKPELTKDQMASIVYLRKNGVPSKEIAEIFACSRRTVLRVAQFGNSKRVSPQSEKKGKPK